MKLSTHQYAKSQIKWIRKQLLPAVKEARSLGGEVEVYVVRGGQEGQGPAIRLLDCEYQLPVIGGPVTDSAAFLSGETMPSWKDVGHPDAAELLAELEQAGDSRVPDTEA